MQTRQPNPIQEFLSTKSFRENRLWVMRNGMFFTEVDGKLMSEEIFNTMFPVFNPVTFVHTKENIDTTTAWIRN